MKNKEFGYLKNYILDNHDEQRILKDKLTKEVYSEIFVINERQSQHDSFFDDLDVFLHNTMSDGEEQTYIGYTVKYLDEYEDLIERSDSKSIQSFKSINSFFNEMKKELSEAIDIPVHNFEFHNNHTARFLTFIQDIEKNLLKYKLEDQLKTQTTSKKSMKI